MCSVLGSCLAGTLCFGCFSRSRRRAAAKEKLRKEALTEAKALQTSSKAPSQADAQSVHSRQSFRTLDGSEPKDAFPFGRLKLKLDYDFVNSQLLCHVISAAAIPAADLCGTSDPYVKVYIKPSKKKKYETKIKRKTLDPVFNETFSFGIPYNELGACSAVFAVYDFDRMSADDRLGQVTVPLAGQDLGGIREEEWWPLEAPLEESTADRLGDICFSLRYNHKTGKLTITILEARNLKKMDVAGYSDPYVKIEIFENGRRLKKKKTGVKFQSLSPYYNESFQFIIPPEQMEEVDVVVSVWDYDRLSSNDFIGQVVVAAPQAGPLVQGRKGKGRAKDEAKAAAKAAARASVRPQVSPAATDHFAKMMSGRRPVAKWHTLQPQDDQPDSNCITS